MAREGISYEVVAQAANQLTAEGKNATIENVRFITGTGSSTTIAMHLRTWKGYNKETKTLKDDILPEGIVLAMKGLWTHVIKEAQEQIAPIKQNLEQSVTELKMQLQALQEEIIYSQQQYQQLKLEKETVDKENILLKQSNHQLENEKIAMTTACEGMLKQLQEKQDRINEVQLLNQQAQANLEHFRESTREQRLIDEQRHQQIQIQLEQMITQVSQELMSAKQENVVLNQQNQQLNFENNNRETQLNKLNAEHASICIKLTESLNEISQKTHSIQHWKEQHNALAIKCDEQGQLFLELQTQYALSLQEATTVKAEYKEIAEQNKLLVHEKWILGQEKAQLYGQLKQLQEMHVSRT